MEQSHKYFKILESFHELMVNADKVLCCAIYTYSSLSYPLVTSVILKKQSACLSTDSPNFKESSLQEIVTIGLSVLLSIVVAAITITKMIKKYVND